MIIVVWLYGSPGVPFVLMTRLLSESAMLAKSHLASVPYVLLRM
jgi:hypothetical protein